MATATIERSGDGGGTSSVDPFAACLRIMGAALADVVDAPAWSLTDEALTDRIAATLAVSAGVDELLARLVGSALERELARLAGASSPTAWLACTQGLSRGAAAGIVASAQAVDDTVPATRVAWSKGQLTTEQAVLIAETVTSLGATVDLAARTEAEVYLIDQAPRFTFTQLRHLANHVVQVVDPDGADAKLGELLQAEEARALQATTFTARKGVDGIGRFTGKLPNLQLDMLTIALDALTSPRRNPANPPGTPLSDTVHGPGTSDIIDADGAHSDTEIGVLTYSQRRGRAFLELIEHLPTVKLPQHGVANAQIVVTLDANTLGTGVGEATLDTGGAISASEARRLACNAGLLPIVLDGPSKILDLGMSQRLFDRHQRIALAARDNGCIWAGCDRPPAWCEAHHIKRWSEGGPTDLSNGCLLCGFHHRLLHQGEWNIAMAADGIPELLPPPRIDPHRIPIRHQRHKPRAG